MAQPECQEIQELLVEIAEGTLSAAQRGRIDFHLRECPECKELIKSFEQVWGGLGATRSPQAFPSLWPALEKALDKQPKPTAGPLDLLAGFLRPVAALLLILAGTYLGLQLGKAPSRQGWENRAVYVESYLQDWADIPQDSLAALYLTSGQTEKEETP